jgi:gluconokinase
MSHPLVLSVDVGSSSVRASFFDAEGGSLKGTESRRPHKFVFSAEGHVEADADALARLVETCIDESLQRLSDLALDPTVVAVSFCSFLHGMIGADDEGRALTPLMTWADTRSADQAARLSTMLDPGQVLQRTGCPLHPAYFPAKILWIRESRPQLFEQVDWWCSIGEYCIRRFTGRKSCSLSMASAFGLLNRRTSGWDEELLRTLGLEEDRFSPLADMDSPARNLLSPFTERWPGLRDAAWLPALGDGICSSVGCGCAVPRRSTLMIGTTGALRAMRPLGDFHIPAGLWCYRMNRKWEQVGGVLGDGGNLFEWLRGTLNVGLNPERIDNAILAAKPAGHGVVVLPFFTGERSTGWNPRARGTVSGLRLETSPLDILQASMEAVAYRFLAIMQVLRPVAPAVEEVICTGAALLHSASWGQILADVLELPLGCADEPEASSRGAALLALEALGYLASAEAPSPPIVRTFFPRAGTAEAHRAAFNEQERLREAVLGVQQP